MTLEPYPESPESTANPEEVDEFLEAVLFHYILRCEEGQPPDPDSYLARYPRFAESLAAMIAGGVDAPLVLDSPGTATRERRRGWRLSKIGNYKIQFLAASTGSSHVYQAECEETQRKVAVKVHRRDQQVDPSEVERFRREAEILAELDVDGVVPLIDVGEEEGSLYVVMPWVEGITLTETIQILRGERQPGRIDPRPLTAALKARIVLQVATSLTQVHDRGILHRDLKPSNIMLDGKRSAVLIDFGIARKEGASALTRTHDQVQGTPRYLSPEILSGEVHSTSVQGEVYALGLTLYELLLERPAYQADSRKTLFDAVLKGPPPPPTQVDRTIPGAVSQAVTRAICHDTSKRFVDMASFAKALEEAIEAPREQVSQTRWGLVALALILAAALFWFLSK